jgi:hypothetical protein
MRCDEVLLLLGEFRDGALGAAATESVRAHLGVCARCRDARAWDTRLHSRVRDEAMPAPPANLAAAVWRRVRRRRQRLRAALVGAAAVLVGVGLVARQWPTEPQISPPRVVETPRVGGDLPEALVLFQPPPVDPLDVLSRQQSGYVAVLQTLGRQ